MGSAERKDAQDIGIGTRSFRDECDSQFEGNLYGNR